MRSRDWSSDVCSSDLQGEARAFAEAVLAVLIPVLIVFSALLLIVMPWVMGLFASDALRADGATFDLAVLMARLAFPYLAFMSAATLFAAVRSEERRVGKEGVSQFRSRWSPYH